MISRDLLESLPTASLDAVGPSSHRRVITNSREVVPGDLFVALIGARDGHEFVASAIEAGATGVLVSEPVEAPDGITVVRVDDTLQALRDLATSVRAAADVDVLALTGSVGKTTLKDVLAHVLGHAGGGREVQSTPKSYNNHLGVPLTLLALEETTTDLISEIGTNHPGEIADLVALVRPRAAIVTNIGHAHLGNFASREALADEKASIYGGVQADGVWFVNADDDLLRAAVARLDKPADTRVITYGVAANADVRVEDVAVTEAGTTGRFGSLSWTLPLVGTHFGTTAAAVFAVAQERGLDLEAVAAALATFGGSPGRAAISLLDNGRLRVIDDTYNGSPDSMLAGLTTLGAMPEQRRVAVLGEMVELGDWSEAMHHKVGERVGQTATDLVFVGPSFPAVRDAAVATGLPPENAHHATSATAAGRLLKGLLSEDERSTAVFVKGSRFTHTERVVLILEGVEVGCERELCELYIHCRNCPLLLG